MAQASDLTPAGGEYIGNYTTVLTYGWGTKDAEGKYPYNNVYRVSTNTDMKRVTSIIVGVTIDSHDNHDFGATAKKNFHDAVVAAVIAAINNGT